MLNSCALPSQAPGCPRAALRVLPAGPQDVPGVLREAYRAMGTGSQLVSKGRQGAEAANQVQVSPSDFDVLSIDKQQRQALHMSQEQLACASGAKDAHGAAAACPDASTPYVAVVAGWLCLAHQCLPL